jgi:hypothetical protein
MPEDLVLSQEVKELVRGTRQAVGSNFLGSLESFLVYLESLMEYCKLFLADTAVEAIMKVSPALVAAHMPLGKEPKRYIAMEASFLCVWSRPWRTATSFQRTLLLRVL